MDHLDQVGIDSWGNSGGSIDARGVCFDLVRFVNWIKYQIKKDKNENVRI